MTIRVTIKHDEPEGPSPGTTLKVKVTVVTVGAAQADEHQVLLAAGEQATVDVGPGQFVMVDDKEA